MLRRTGGERGSCKKVSIVENTMNSDIRRLQADILAEIRNRSAFPLRKVANKDYNQQDSSLGM